MKILNTIVQVREVLQSHRLQKRTIGFVPTMGALHEGHLALIRQCRSECDVTAVSIYVNPAQFGPTEDLSKYPRTFESDCKACEELDVDLIFAPDNGEIYAEPNLIWVDVDRLGEHLCGASRPGHFRGVCTVVAKLFNIVASDRAYFGEKDAQQLAIIQRMVADLHFPVEIVPCPTVREPNGLALSSRNRYLSPEQRSQATCLYRALQHAAGLIEQGQTDPQVVVAAMEKIIQAEPEARIDYISIVDIGLLQPVEKIDRPVRIALGVHLGPARLIDNLRVDPADKVC